MIFITFVFAHLYPDGEDCQNKKEPLLESITELFHLYEEAYKKEEQKNNSNVASSSEGSVGLGKRSYEAFLDTELVNIASKSELDIYLTEMPDRQPAGGTTFDVLQWWKGNQSKFPILSMMARDILSIPVTTVASESTFSAGKRVIDAKRASMNTETVEILLCGGDWVK